MSAYWLTGDTRKVTAELAAAGVEVDLVLTSPPFLALRSYLPDDHPDKGSEIGSEPNPAEFVGTLLELTAGWETVLAPHGTIAVELGDTYAGSGGAGGDYAEDGLRAGQQTFRQNDPRKREGKVERYPLVRNAGGRGWPDDKSLCMIPELYRVALAYGIHPLTGQPSPAGRWRLRNVVRWVRPNPPVGALGDKFRPGTSDMAIACKARDRWFDLDAVRTPADPANKRRSALVRKDIGGRSDQVCNPLDDDGQRIISNPAGAPPLDWWSISPGGYSGAHYAVFPPELLVRPIEAMCPRRVCLTCGKPSRREVDVAPGVGGLHQATDGGSRTVGGHPGGHRSQMGERNATTTGWSSCGCPGTDGIRIDGFHTGTGWRPGRVLDPFAGSGTTLAVSSGHGRESVGIDLDGRNADLARERVGMFLSEVSVAELAQRWSSASPRTLDGARASA